MKKQVLSFISVLFSTLLVAQNDRVNDPVIMNVNGKNVKKSEFEYIYKKNNTEEAIDRKSLEEYLELFKNFKLKVIEAESLGLDTVQAFRDELNGYKTELIKTYQSNLLDENLIRKEYDRMKEDVEIAHILITFNGKELTGQDAKNMRVYPADTLTAYKKALQIRKRLLQKGEDFGKVAIEESNDKISLEGGAPGYLGWFTALRLMPELEDGAYNTPVGRISMPVRSQYGYHLIKVLKRQQDPGQIRVSHILVECPDNADTVRVSDAEKRVDDIYKKVLKGEDFGELAKKYSDDKASGAREGDLPWFGYGRMVKEFEVAAFELSEIGTVTPPVRTKFGFHIIKLLEKRQIAPIEEVRPEIIDALKRNGRHVELVEPRMEKMKQENGFSLNNEVFNELQQAANTLYPLSPEFLSKFENNRNTLFLTGSTAYTVSQFVRFIRENDAPQMVLSTDLLNERLQGFELDCLIEEENRQLETKYPEFKNLMQEYRDGILLYNIMNSEVWEKANQDSAGLKVFFELHKTDYSWEQPHYKGFIVLCKDSKTKKKMQKEVAKMTPEEASDYLNANYKVGDVSHVQIEKGLFVKGDNPFVDEAVFKTGKAICPEEYSDFFVIGKLLNTPDDYNDVRGLVVTDYQTYLEKMWVEYLDQKYPVIIYKEVVNTIK
ncbi:peptidyl-prolyl cis-trans isomerase [Bacteroidia bacterium]|nr:peptidyl-prolyl cis-trans isomerase [Bacteroidia bacterium]